MAIRPEPTLGTTRAVPAGVPAQIAALGFVLAYLSTELVLSGAAVSLVRRARTGSQR